MAADKKKDHTLLYGALGVVGLYLLYEWWKSQQTMPAPVITTPGGPSSSTITVPGGVVPANSIFPDYGRIQNAGIPAPQGTLNINYAISGMGRRPLGYVF